MKSSSHQALHIALATVSDRHTPTSDSTGDWLADAIVKAGHHMYQRQIIGTNKYLLRAVVSRWIAEPQLSVVLLNGSTGFAEHNAVPEALAPLLEQQVEGFGELFRQLSWQQIGSSAMQSRAFAGLANNTLVIAVPGAESAAQLAWEQLIQPQLNSEQGPCNFVGRLTRHG
ncbi:molybdenum cofactor synthesis domain-containing protein [Pseudidiomarina terrestris]|uniref:Molybdenum cofactor biosynthesis protein B n=1 Tax=Pseudidiomarina terrestris TaxID=2820060 RepID=A0AAW7R286_9GAMM|nr:MULTISPECIES: molybdenum cofactor synthesis domain-containing protein [unclassified Pseudidiomarina]MDN7124735.1 molybdenum cofactor biosynthesis protein [Pseudidiomarina sp. 1APP75-32.1]MDN7125792.1 molybdenum cofactor biosynthesis protein [Pseudidiomarina sp. 1APR75-33.1]MDN7129791.1 molybdenum cofactor biosynthesis protein [Pseudidiomarina sp. 1APR75-15]MDN7136432.1 molybdenum cofactor biosynthesis protein [Pseudidiomarina sp. 1ASP75-5]MDN7137952.1 molybdenum cofactor biosynthesis protei